MSLLSKKINDAVTFVIRGLPVRPTGPTGRFTAAQLQAFFDQASESIRVAFNGLIDELREATAASELGFQATEYVNERNVQDAIENVQAQIRGIAQDEAVLPNGSISGEKIAPDADIDGSKLADNSIGPEKLMAGAAGWVKLSSADIGFAVNTEGNASGSSINVLGGRFWYSKALNMVFWSATASIEPGAGAGANNVFFRVTMTGEEKYLPFLDTTAGTRIDYGANCFTSFNVIASIAADTYGHGSFLYVLTENPQSGMVADMSGFYICAGE